MEDFGLFNLEEFIDFPVLIVHEYFTKKGWEMVECFNDYKWAWIHNSLNKSIIAKVDWTEDDKLIDKGFIEIINSIWYFEGIYKENF